MNDHTSAGFVCQLCGVTWQGSHSCTPGHGVGVGAICFRCGSMYCATPGACSHIWSPCTRCGFPGGSASWELLAKLAKDRRDDRAQARQEALEEAAKFLEEHAKGYEDAAAGAGMGGYIAQAHLLREKAGGLRQLAKGEPAP